MHRREFLAAGSALFAGALVPAARAEASVAGASAEAPKFRLGTVTYNVGAKMDLPTLLSACKAAGFEAVELRTTHAHGVEPALPAARRQETRQRFADSGLQLWGLGSVCEFHSPDATVLRHNVDDCRAFCQLAANLGARGVKVRPNGLPGGIEPARTLEQIGLALRECGRAAEDLGVEIWVEVHGSGTALPRNMRAIIDHCGHKAVGICWNSNASDLIDGSLEQGFELLKKDIRSCHINELWNDYPWRDLFARLRRIGYDRVTLMEVAGVPEAPDARSPEGAIRFMRYYRALWRELTR